MFPVDERVPRTVQQPQQPRGQAADKEYHVPRGQGLDFGIVARTSGRTSGTTGTGTGAGTEGVNAY